MWLGRPPAPQDADRERVEGAEGGARVGGRVSSVGAGALDFGPWTLDSFRDQFRHALLHFAGGFVGEGDAQDVSRRNSALDHLRDAISDHARFARSGPGNDLNG